MSTRFRSTRSMNVSKGESAGLKTSSVIENLSISRKWRTGSNEKSTVRKRESETWTVKRTDCVTSSG